LAELSWAGRTYLGQRPHPEHATLYRNLYPSAASQQTADAYREVIRTVCRRLAADLGRRAGTAATEVVADFLIGGIIEVSRLGTEVPATGSAPPVRKTSGPGSTRASRRWASGWADVTAAGVRPCRGDNA
jgi:hypothetical protein